MLAAMVLDGPLWYEGPYMNHSNSIHFNNGCIQGSIKQYSVAFIIHRIHSLSLVRADVLLR